jgi:hypothetical protein
MRDYVLKPDDDDTLAIAQWIGQVLCYVGTGNADD